MPKATPTTPTVNTSIAVTPTADADAIQPVLGVTQGSVIPPHVLRVLLATAAELESDDADAIHPVLGITQGSVIPPSLLRVLLATAAELESDQSVLSNTSGAKETPTADATATE